MAPSAAASTPEGSPPGDDAGAPRFVCDEMLGQLAKWLRILGYDAAYMKHVEDAELLDRARREGRVLLTRDVQVVERAEAAAAEDGPKALLVEPLEPDEQVPAVLAALGLEPDEGRLLSRCSVCNAAVEEVPDDEVEAVLDGADVPLGARGHDVYWRCPSCGRVYWEGTHVEGIRGQVAAWTRQVRGKTS